MVTGKEKLVNGRNAVEKRKAQRKKLRRARKSKRTDHASKLARDSRVGGGVARNSQGRGTGDCTGKAAAEGLGEDEKRDTESTRGARGKRHARIVSNVVVRQTRMYLPYTRPGHHQRAPFRYFVQFSV